MHSIARQKFIKTRRALGGAHVGLPLTKVFRRLTGRKTMLKPRIAAAANTYVYFGFSGRKIPRTSAYTIAEKAIRFPD